VTLVAPQPLADHHQSASFSCGVASLDDWLCRRARTNQADDASRTYVLCDDRDIVGYYALASAGLAVVEAPGRFRRNMPDPIPVAVLGRLAVDARHHGRGIGRALFRDAALRIIRAGDIIGIRGMIVHAISDDAKAFYQALGLTPSPREPMMLMVTLSDLRASLR
jgi:GNAT superfamily N-acetyltransferase